MVLFYLVVVAFCYCFSSLEHLAQVELLRSLDVPWASVVHRRASSTIVSNDMSS